MSLVHRPQDKALPEGNRSGGRCQRALLGPRHEAIHSVAQWLNVLDSWGLGAEPSRARVYHKSPGCQRLSG
jgi:hypothetical protein